MEIGIPMASRERDERGTSYARPHQTFTTPTRTSTPAKTPRARTSWSSSWREAKAAGLVAGKSASTTRAPFLVVMVCRSKFDVVCTRQGSEEKRARGAGGKAKRSTCCKNRRAVAWPRPEAAPVTRAVTRLSTMRCVRSL